MILAVPPEKWEILRRIVASEDVEAVAIGTFEQTGRLKLRYRDHLVGDLDFALPARWPSSSRPSGGMDTPGLRFWGIPGRLTHPARRL
jgi:phosphoribosylformylglycinamidine (FGAM) synthase-like enzyme